MHVDLDSLGSNLDRDTSQVSASRQAPLAPSESHPAVPSPVRLTARHPAILGAIAAAVGSARPRPLIIGQGR